MTSSSPSGFRFWLITVAAVMGVAATLSMGRWQLSRAAEKEALHAQRLQQAALPALTAQVLVAPVENPVPERLQDRQLTLQGRWLPAFTLALDNRPMNARQGFYIMTPLQVTNSGKVVWVQRGWLPRDFKDRERLSAYVTPAGEVTVTGRIARGVSQTFSLGGDAVANVAAPSGATASQNRIRQNLSLAAFQAESKLPLWEYLLVQTSGEADGLLRDWPLPNMGVEKHYGYAFQWFGLSALIAILYVWFQLIVRRPRKN